MGNLNGGEKKKELKGEAGEHTLFLRPWREEE